jgi:transcriptional regulator with XRE-family HTH domain
MTGDKTLGALIRRRRSELNLTQRQLADLLGVRASYVGYLEQGQRRPSLQLLNRLADTLSLPKEKLLLLTHPEARALLQSARGSRGAPQATVWHRFRSDPRILARHKISPQEMKILSSINALGTVASPRDYLFILRTIRQAIEED